MIATRLLSREHVLRVLGIYGCHHVSGEWPGFELWETGWGTPFTLSPEQNGSYDEWQLQRVVTMVIALTLPPTWFPNGSPSKDKP
jgi:hypothetical protein